jgi:multicomponent Na+:H+ antiporter subunit E
LKKLIISSVCLLLVWFLLSGFFKTNFIVLGVLSSLFVSWLAVKLDIFSDNGEHLRINLRAIGYAPWLLKEIIKSNLHVARIILDPKLPVEPQAFWIEGSQKTDIGLAIHANSLTLTPGTISLAVEDNKLHVHAVSSVAAQGAKNGDIDRKVAGLENFIK